MIYTVVSLTGVRQVYNTIEEICNNYAISKPTVLSLIDGTCSFRYRQTKALQGLKIIRGEIEEERIMKINENAISFREVAFKKAEEEYLISNSEYEEYKKHITASNFTLVYPNGEIFGFDSIEDVCIKLKLVKSTIYSIINESCKFEHASTKHLKGLKILTHRMFNKKIKINNDNKDLLDVIILEYEDFILDSRRGRKNWTQCPCEFLEEAVIRTQELKKKWNPVLKPLASICKELPTWIFETKGGFGDSSRFLKVM
jgi:hypothetical protein